MSYVSSLPYPNLPSNVCTFSPFDSSSPFLSSSNLNVFSTNYQSYFFCCLFFFCLYHKHGIGNTRQNIQMRALRNGLSDINSINKIHFWRMVVEPYGEAITDTRLRS